MNDPVLVEVTRGRSVESRHTGAMAIVDTKGKRRVAIGDVDRRIFPRSAIKSMQALPLVESGAADRYGFGNPELALACSSHSGEPRHVETARKMLAAAGRSEADLECGGHIPMSQAAADALVRANKPFGRIHDNCSGKHSGFVCLSCGLGADPKGYTNPTHPAQREVAVALADVTGGDVGEPAIDGCSAPAYAIPLAGLALGFARMVTGKGLSNSRARAARRLVEACTAESFMVAGTGRFDTEVFALLGNRVFIKGGAEGVSCAAFPGLGLGVAIKCDDGAQRGPEVLMAAVIDVLLPLTDVERQSFVRLLTPPVLSRTNQLVGEIRVVDGLREKLRAS